MATESKISFHTKDELNHYWVMMYRGNSLVGRCNVVFPWSKTCILSNFIIYKRFRGQGYSHQLLDEVIKRNPRLALWVKKENKVAQYVYKKHGFKELIAEDCDIMMIRS